MKKYLLLIFILVLAGCVKQGPETIQIGVIAPLTGSATSYGNPITKIAELAKEDVNARGGINGVPIEFIVEDGKCNPKDASTAAQKLVQHDGVRIIYGGLCSGETLGASTITEANNVILFSSASTATAISDAGDYVFRNFPHVGLGATKVAEKAIEQEHKKVAMLSELTDYAQSVRENFKERYEELGGVVVIDEQFEADETSFQTAYTKILESDADALYIVGQTPTTIEAMLQQKGELGVDLALYADIVAAGKALREKYPDELEGAVFAEPYLDEESPEVQRFFLRLEEEFGSIPDSLPNLYWTAAYDAIWILQEALSVCREDTVCIRDHLYAIESRQGLSGTLHIDENGDASIPFVVKQIRSGEAVEMQ